jgi:hypothetical protein
VGSQPWGVTASKSLNSRAGLIFVFVRGPGPQQEVQFCEPVKDVVYRPEEAADSGDVDVEAISAKTPPADERAPSLVGSS